MRALRKPEHVFLFVALAFGFLYLLITRPYDAPDESQHFMYAVRAAYGGFASGAEIPASIVAFDKQAYWEMRDPLTSTFDLQQALKIPLQEHEKVFLERDRRTSYFTPLPYLPAMLVVQVGVLFEQSPVMLLYLSRAALMLTGIALLFLAIRFSPVLQWPMTIVALLPTMVSGRAAVSADTITIGIAFLFFAYVMRSVFRQERFGWREGVVLAGLAIALSLCKIVYALLALMVVIIPAVRFSSLIVKWLCIAAIVLPGIVVNALISISGYAAAVVEPHFFVVLLQHPVDMALLLLRTLGSLLVTFDLGSHPEQFLAGVTEGAPSPLPADWWGRWNYVRGAIASFYPWVWFCFVCILLLGLSVFIPASEWKPGRCIRVSALVLFMGIFGAILTAIFLATTSRHGADAVIAMLQSRDAIILGFQGRYLVPVMPLLLLGCMGWGVGGLQKPREYMGWVVTLGCSLILLPGLWLLYRSGWGY